ncbi:MAG TPA: hypothetical protein VIT65_08910 [Microlunatus sp.]
MIDALRYEGVRLRTIASTYWTLLLGVALCALVALGFGLETRGIDLAPAEVTFVLTAGGADLPFPLLGMVIAVIGILSAGHEYRYRTIYPTLTVLPRRSVLLAAKVLTVAYLAAVAAVIMTAICWLVGSLVRREPLPLSDERALSVIVGYVLLVVLYGVLGVSLGQLTRSIPAALVILLVTPLVVEPVISALSGLAALGWLGDVVVYLPFAAGMQLLSVDAPVAGTDALGPWNGGAVFAGFVALLLSTGWILFERRDA